ncbi:hypothetical protein BJ322DRAFT_203505 [Thelephora terrestris]|uniref:VWFA domain-containing protein n=1 Tax=Thelephora terrestris TaxID=56493 RepID=A0A9P6HAN4_9AGAM|nr:hypothetical protein BJ322DRAFT_203505 [Thelephora terrestris]
MIGILKSFLSPTPSSSSCSQQRPVLVNTRSQFGPGSSKADYARGLNPSSPSISRGLAQSYYDDDQPPSYSPGSVASCNHNQRLVGTNRSTPHNSYTPKDSMGESPLKVLENYDIVIVFDDSRSMLCTDRGRRTRWDQAWDALATLVRVGSQYDRDGIDIHFLNQRNADRAVHNEAEVQRLRSSVGKPGEDSYTPIGDVLETLLLDYQRKTGDSPGSSGVKKRIFLVITDGAATDAPEYPILNAARFFERGRFPLDQVGIQFIQVGGDECATKFLEELDDDLAVRGQTRDIVDTIKSTGNDLEGDALIKALTGGFNRRQDKASGARR